MAFTAGYLAGIFKSEKVDIGGAAEEVHMLAGTEGVSGQFSNILSLDWWDLTEGTGSISWGATYGRGGHSGGCKIVAIAADVSMGQTITFGTALTEVKKFSLSLWAKLATTKEATLTVTFNNAAGAAIEAASVLTITADNASYGDTNWGYWSLFLDVPVLTKTIVFSIAPTSAQTMYIDNVRATCLLQVIGAHEQLSIDLTAEREDVTTFKSAQDEGAFRTFVTLLTNAGELTIRNYWGVQKWWDATVTYSPDGSCGSAGPDIVQHEGRSYTCILESLNNEPPNATYWTILGSESQRIELVSGEKLFVILFTDVESADQRYEFWALVPQVGITAPLAGVAQNPFTLLVDGLVGYVDRAKD